MRQHQRYALNALVGLKQIFKRQLQLKAGYEQDEFEKGVAKGIRTAISAVDNQMNLMFLFLDEEEGNE